MTGRQWSETDGSMFNPSAAHSALFLSETCSGLPFSPRSPERSDACWQEACAPSMPACSACLSVCYMPMYSSQGPSACKCTGVHPWPVCVSMGPGSCPGPPLCQALVSSEAHTSSRPSSSLPWQQEAEAQQLLRKSPGRHPGRDWGLSPWSLPHFPQFVPPLL